MRIQRQKFNFGFKRSVCMGMAFLLFVVIGAGCVAQTPPPEQGSHIKIQGGQNSAEVSWPK